jgi:hypothetical protein
MASVQRKVKTTFAFRGQWRIELECGHFVERAKGRSVPAKLACSECTKGHVMISVLQRDVDAMLETWRDRQIEMPQDIADAIGDCIEDVKRLIGDHQQ